MADIQITEELILSEFARYQKKICTRLAKYFEENGVDLTPREDMISLNIFIGMLGQLNVITGKTLFPLCVEIMDDVFSGVELSSDRTREIEELVLNFAPLLLKNNPLWANLNVANIIKSAISDWSFTDKLVPIQAIAFFSHCIQSKEIKAN